MSEAGERDGAPRARAREPASLSLPDGWIVYPLSPAVRVRVTGPPPTLDPRVGAEVDRIWAAARRARPALFDGVVFSADRVAPDVISGYWTHYRQVLAQIAAPELFPALGVRSLAVCGLLVCDDGVVFGQRERGAVYQPGMWQLPPAGSLDAGSAGADGVPDLRAQLLTELREELGVPAAHVRDITPLCAVEHPGSHVLDLGMALRVPLPGATLAARHAAAGNTEYERITVVPPARLAAQMATWGTSLTPAAHAFIARWQTLCG